jgi:hypothetical protein
MKEIVNFIFSPWEYLGPWTDLEKAGAPVSFLDSRAKIHDYAYREANRYGGRRGRVEKTKADYEMAFTFANPLVSSYLFTQATLRVFTFNMVEFPW